VHFIHTFPPQFDPALLDFPPSILDYNIEPQGNMCKLTLTMEALPYPDDLLVGLIDGQSFILSHLKTFLETDQPLGSEA
jgi:hypothetical protein